MWLFVWTWMRSGIACWTNQCACGNSRMENIIIFRRNNSWAPIHPNGSWILMHESTFSIQIARKSYGIYYMVPIIKEINGFQMKLVDLIQWCWYTGSNTFFEPWWIESIFFYKQECVFNLITESEYKVVEVKTSEIYCRWKINVISSIFRMDLVGRDAVDWSGVFFSNKKTISVL